MTRRYGETTRSLLYRNYPHRVAMPAEALQGSLNSAAMRGLAKALGGALSPFHLSQDGRDRRVFCFATAEAAQTFQWRFGGEVLT